MSLNRLPRTRLAFLGTLDELHREPLAYDLACLRAIVADRQPDLLCVEVTRADWERGDLAGGPPEVREALAPVVASTDIVLVPVAPTPRRFADFAPAGGWRRAAVRAFDRALRWGQRRAGRAEAVNGPAFGAFCHTVCLLTELAWSPRERAGWAAENRAFADNVLAAVARDPGRRVLVAVQCQRLHQLLPLVRAHHDELELVSYRTL